MKGVTDPGAEEPAPVDPERVVDRIAERGESIKRRELEEAFARFDRTLGPEERVVLRTMADRIAGSLLAAPAVTVERAEERDDPEAIRAVTRIFDPGGDD